MEVQYTDIIAIAIALALASIGFVAWLRGFFTQWPPLIIQIALLIIVSAVSFALGIGARILDLSPTGGQNILLFIAGVIGVRLTYWRISVLDKQRKISDEHVKNDTQRLHNEEQRLHTDTYIRAVEQLSSAKNGENGKTEPNIAVRVGAISGLEKIAYESEDHTYQVLGLLSSYICEHAGSYESKELFPPPRNDIYTALKSIARRMKKNRPHENYEPHLRMVDLKKTNLSDFELNYFNLSQSRLEGSLLINTQLVGANLIAADLTLSDLHMANLERAFLDQANLVGADMIGAKNLTQEQINEAFGDGGTKLPGGLTAPQHWPQRALDISLIDMSKSREEWKKWMADPENYQPPQ